MRFLSLGSGSGGNALVVEARNSTTTTRVLVDCGFSLRELVLRLARARLEIDDLDAVFLTHEHGDHVGCAPALARRQKIPLWTSRGTWQALGDVDLGITPDIARDGDAIEIGDLCLMPYTVAHDAREPLQLTCTDGMRRLGVLTDVGSITPHLLSNLAGCDALLLECNHDADLLAASTYPASLKARIAGPHGHLSNAAAASILASCVHPGLRHVVAAHLSERNNRPQLARAALASALAGNPEEIAVADPHTGFDWITLR